MNNVIPVEYHGATIKMTSDGWLNATQIAKQYGKRPIDWIRLPETVEYMEALARFLNVGKSHNLIRTERGRTGGTWLHPKLAVLFARWLNVDFAVWADMTIDNLLRGETSIKRNHDRACQALDDQNARGSHAGRELNRHRYAKPPLEREVDYWREQLQLKLSIE